MAFYLHFTSFTFETYKELEVKIPYIYRTISKFTIGGKYIMV